MNRTLLAGVFSLVAGLVVAQTADSELFREAERRFMAGNYELALDRYQTLIAQYPVSQFVPDAQFRMGVALYRLGRGQEAFDQLSRVDRRYRSSRFIAYVPFWQGVISYEHARYREAIEYLSRFVEVSEESETGTLAPDETTENQAFLYLALARLELGDAAGAIAALEALLADEADPTAEPYAVTLLASLLVQAERPDAVLSLASRIDLTRFPVRNQAQMLLYQAEALRQRGAVTEAVARYREVERAPAEVATLAFQRLFQLAQQGLTAEEPADVLRRAEQTLAGRTDVLAGFWLRVGTDSFEQGRYDLAELYLRRIWDLRAVEQVPATVPLYLSRLLDRRGDLEAAEAILTDYLGRYGDASGERLRVLIALGNLQLRLSRLSQAVATLMVAVDEYPESEFFGEAAYQYAFALRRSDRPADALAVIDRAFAVGRTGGVQADLLRLRARLLRETADDRAALQALFEYVSLQPGDGDAAAEYANLLFTLERYNRAADELPPILGELSTRSALTSGVEARLRYVLGLSELQLGRYAAADRTFGRVLELLPTGDRAVDSLESYAIYYAAWAAYRSGEYASGRNGFELLVSRFPSSQFALRASYLSGWSSYQLREYGAAAEALARVRTYATGPDLQLEASFLLGRTLAAQGSLQQAASTFRTIYLDHPESEYADDSWLEYGEVLLALGNTDGAIAAFAELAANYPQSPLAESAAFRRAEVSFQQARYREAQEAYYAYRTGFPEGRRTDAALYWGGVASAELGETAGALLVWERLIDEYRQSGFRADALQRSAQAHEARSEYRQALNRYTEFQAAYPEIAGRVNVQRRIDEIVLILNGLSEREAELFVTIEERGGATSDTGRAAIITLARLVITEGTGSGTDPATVIPLLDAVSERAAVDPASASQALYLRGEYASRQGEFLRAADFYLRAAAVGVEDRELAALSLYRAASMYSRTGRVAEMNALVERLEQDFPRSEWLEEARTLRGGTN